MNRHAARERDRAWRAWWTRWARRNGIALDAPFTRQDLVGAFRSGYRAAWKRFARKRRTKRGDDLPAR